MSETNNSEQQPEITSIIITPTPEFLRHVANIAVESIKQGEATCEQITRLQENIQENGPLNLAGSALELSDTQLILEGLDEKYHLESTRIQRLKDALTNSTSKKEEENS